MLVLVCVAVVSGALLPINLALIGSLSRSDALVAEQCTRGVLKAVTRGTTAFTAVLALVIVTVTLAGA